MELITRTNSRSKQTKLIQSRFLRIYCYIFVGSLMSYLRSICATTVDKLRETTRRTHTHTRIRLQLRTGICIIRLITLKRFHKILAMPRFNHQVEMEEKQHEEKEQDNQKKHEKKQQLKSEEKGMQLKEEPHKLQLEKEQKQQQLWEKKDARYLWHSLGTQTTLAATSCWRHRASGNTATWLVMLLLLSSHWPDCECLHGAKLSNSTVKTKYGLLRGIVVRSTPPLLVEAFLGIPYASPPVGSLR